MNVQPITIIFTIVGGLIVAGIAAWIRKPRLFLLVPRMFSYSQITDKGHLVEITVFNRGFKTEEAIEITLNPKLSYEILGTNNQDVSLERNKLKIPRIGPSDEVTSLLIVENGVFKKDDITQCLSKETKAVVVSKLEEVSLTGPQRIVSLITIVGFALLTYTVFFGLDFLTTKVSENIFQEDHKTVREESKSVEFQGWKIANAYATINSALFNNFAVGKIRADLKIVERKKDTVTMAVVLENRTGEMVEASSIEMSTAKSSGHIPNYELRVFDVMLFPQKIEEKQIKILIPEKSNEILEKTVFVEMLLQDTDGDTLKLKREFLVN